MVGVGRIGQGREKEGVNGRLGKKKKSWVDLFESGEIVAKNIMPEDKVGTTTKIIQFCQQRPIDSFPADALECLLSQDSAQGIDLVVFVDLNVKQKALLD
jgi:hypothetical protein